MSVVRQLRTLLALSILCGCTGGGGGGVSIPVAAWEKFRHDQSNSGRGTGAVENNDGKIKWQTMIDQSPIISSPAVGRDGTVYVATEKGTLAALDPANGGIKWSVCSCPAAGSVLPATCSADPPDLGPLRSSPAVYTFGTRTSVFIGSSGGVFYGIVDDGTKRSCTIRFQPAATDFGDKATTISAQFVASPAFTINPINVAIASVFTAAAIEVTQNGNTRTVGKLYALNTDGSTNWQFPRVGDAEIGAITASPAVGTANTVYISSADGNLYAVLSDGSLHWRLSVAAGGNTATPFAPSPLVSSVVIAPAADGSILAANPDGSFRWRVPPADGAGFIASLAAGIQTFVTPTATPTTPPTSTPEPSATATPSPTPTAFLTETIFGITTGGTLILLDSGTGMPRDIDGPVPAIVGPVIASPALSSDGYLLIAGADGVVHAVNTTTGEEPEGWPVVLAPGVPIRSSPALSNEGVVYVGADNGVLYAVGTE
jgi:outer membrane protein assembly factor BamB